MTGQSTTFDNYSQTTWIHYMPFLGAPFAIAFDKAMPRSRKVRLRGRFANWRLSVEVLRLLQKLLLVFLDVVHGVCHVTLFEKRTALPFFERAQSPLLSPAFAKD